MEPLQKNKKGQIYFRQGIKKNEISEGSTKKKDIEYPQNKTSKGGIFSSILDRFGGMAER